MAEKESDLDEWGKKLKRGGFLHRQWRKRKFGREYPRRNSGKAKKRREQKAEDDRKQGRIEDF